MPEEHQYSQVIFFFPKEKELATFWLEQFYFLAREKKLYLVGEKRSGIESFIKKNKGDFAVCEKLDSACHSQLWLIVLKEKNNEIKSFNLDRYYQNYEVNSNQGSLTISALPGVFSRAKLDQGTAFLLSTFKKGDISPGRKALDFGCGAGVIAATLSKQYPKLEWDLIDINYLSILSAKKTKMLNNFNAAIFESNGFEEIPSGKKYDIIVSNPPFHDGQKKTLETTERFLRESTLYLSGRGEIRIVANRFLPYLEIMEKHYSQVTIIAENNAFRVYSGKQENIAESQSADIDINHHF